jgi:hypothetical protein
MLKPKDPVEEPEERPIGEVVSQLIDEGKAYARAELKVAKAIATDKANRLKVPAILFVGALLVVLAGLSGLAVGVALALAALVGPLAAGLIVLLLFAGVAGGLAWLGARKLQDVL